MAERQDRLARWIASKMPRREELEKSRWLGPMGERVLHSALWRFTRRSVPRGVAVGLLVGIFLMIPGVQIVGAALMSVPVRGNIPVAVFMTFLSNPFTTPFIVYAAIEIGNSLGFHADTAAFLALLHSRAGVRQWLGWLFSDAAPAVVSGLFIIGAAAAIVGYFASIWIWRFWQARKWRRRHQPPGAAI